MKPEATQERSGFLPGDALIATTAGPKRIADIRPGDEVWSLDEEHGRFVRSKVVRSVKANRAPTLTIRTRGREICSGLRLKFMARRKFPDPQPGMGGYRKVKWSNVWVAASDLHVDDYIVAASAFPSSDGCTAPNGRELTVGFMEFAGLLLGDGTVSLNKSSKTVAIARHQDAPYMDHYRAVAQREFSRCSLGFGDSNFRDRASISLREYERTTIFSSKEAAEELAELGLKGTAKTKRVPAWVFGLAPDLQLGYLRGYMDSDGACDSRGWITYSSCNKPLLEDIRHLCLSLGVPVGVVCTYYPTGPVVINGRTSQRGEIHQLFLFDIAANRRIGSNDPICAARLEAVSPSTHRIDRYAPGFQGRGASPASRPGTTFNLIGCALHFVKSIEEGPVESLYSVAVEENQNFVADALVVCSSLAQLRMPWDLSGPQLSLKFDN